MNIQTSLNLNTFALSYVPRKTSRAWANSPAIIQARADGVTWAALAEKYKCSTLTIRKIVDAHAPSAAIETARGRRYQKQRDEAIRAQRSSEKVAAQAAEQINIARAQTKSAKWAYENSKQSVKDLEQKLYEEQAAVDRLQKEKTEAQNSLANERVFSDSLKSRLDDDLTWAKKWQNELSDEHKRHNETKKDLEALEAQLQRMYDDNFELRTKLNRRRWWHIFG